MPFCPHCGAKHPEKAYYCSMCGKDLRSKNRDEFTIAADELVKTVKHLIHEGNVRRIIIQDEKKKTLLDIPVSVGLVGFIIAPWLAALGVIAAMVTRCTIIVERKPEK